MEATYGWRWPHDFELNGQVLAVQVCVHQTGCATEDPDRAWQHLNRRSCWV